MKVHKTTRFLIILFGLALMSLGLIWLLNHPFAFGGLIILTGFGISVLGYRCQKYETENPFPATGNSIYWGGVDYWGGAEMDMDCGSSVIETIDSCF